MSAAVLDDFFARKDRKKQHKKTKDKYKIEIVEDNLEVKNSNVDYVNGQEDFQQLDIPKNEEDDGEWIEEKVVGVDFTALSLPNSGLHSNKKMVSSSDYLDEASLDFERAVNVSPSGIQHNGDNTAASEFDGGDGESTEDFLKVDIGDSNSAASGKTSGWKTVTNKSEAFKTPQAEESVETATEPKKYIPPSMRKQMQDARKSGKADLLITDYQEFPSLKTTNTRK